jgi:threonine dehydrogenase-like Zn-dependent dehydrogenase
MRAAILRTAGQPLVLDTVPDPEPGPGEVVLRIVRCGICATDLQMAGEGAFAAPAGFILGHERGAEVVALGKGVEHLKIGDAVVPHNSRGCGKCADCLAGIPFFCAQAQMNMAGFAHYMACPEQVCAKIPGGLSLDDAALVEPLAVGLHATELVAAPTGARIAILGAGPMGLAALHWARRTGAGRVAMVATSRRREGVARGMGAEAFLTTGDDLTAELAEALGGAPDAVYECTGKPGTIAQAVDLVRARGTVMVVGMCTHHDPWIPAMAMLKELRIQFAVGTSLRQFRTVADSLAAGHVEPRLMVTDTIRLDALPERFEAMRQGAVDGKVLVDPWG